MSRYFSQPFPKPDRNVFTLISVRAKYFGKSLDHPDLSSGELPRDLPLVPSAMGLPSCSQQIHLQTENIFRSTESSTLLEVGRNTIMGSILPTSLCHPQTHSPQRHGKKPPTTELLHNLLRPLSSARSVERWWWSGSVTCWMSTFVSVAAKSNQIMFSCKISHCGNRATRVMKIITLTWCLYHVPWPYTLWLAESDKYFVFGSVSFKWALL